MLYINTWWRHFPRYIFRVTGHLCGEFPGPGEFPAQRQVTRSFVAFFDLRLNKWLSKQSRGEWFETLSCPLWRHSIDVWVFSCAYLMCAQDDSTHVFNWPHILLFILFLSISGPLLFLLYINDFANVCKSTNPVLYTDDTNLLWMVKIS